MKGERIRLATLLLAGGVIAGTGPAGLAQDEPRPGTLHRLTEAGPSEATVGDLIVIGFQSNPSTGPANPASDLKVEIAGDALRKVAVVYAPPFRPIPGRPGQIQVYLMAGGAGESTVTVTPVSGMGEPGEPREFTVKVTGGE